MVWFAECRGTGGNAVQDAIHGTPPARGANRRKAAAGAVGSGTRAIEEVALLTPLHPVHPGRARRRDSNVRLALTPHPRSLPHWTHPEVTD